MDKNDVNLNGYVDGYTEFWNGEVWKPIVYYKAGEKVLAYNYAKDSVTFELPVFYVHEPWEHFWHIWGDSFDECITGDTNMIGSQIDGVNCEHFVNFMKLDEYREIYEEKINAYNKKDLISKLVFKDGDLSNEQCLEPYNPYNIEEVYDPNGVRFGFAMPSGYFIGRKNGKATILTGDVIR